MQCNITAARGGRREAPAVSSRSKKGGSLAAAFAHVSMTGALNYLMVALGGAVSFALLPSIELLP